MGRKRDSEPPYPVIDTVGVEVLSSREMAPVPGQDRLRGYLPGLRSLKRFPAILAVGSGLLWGGQEALTHVPKSRGEMLDMKAWVFGSDERAELGSLPNHEEMERELIDAIGEEAVHQIIQLNPSDLHSSLRAEAADRELAEGSAEVRGFEQVFGLKSETIRRIVTGTYPRGWATAASVESISAAGPNELPKGVACRREGGLGKESAKIMIAPEAVRVGLDRALGRALANANRWDTANVRSPEDRLAESFQVHRRIHEPGRVRIAGVEQIQDSNPQKVEFSKMHEYRATLLDLALNTPANSEQEWEALLTAKFIAINESSDAAESDVRRDVALAREMLRLSDEHFKPWEAANARRQILADAAHERLQSRIDKIVSEVPSAPLRTLLSRALHEAPSNEERSANALVHMNISARQVAKVPEEIRMTWNAIHRLQEQEVAESAKSLSRAASDAVNTYRRLQDAVDASRFMEPMFGDEASEQRIQSISALTRELQNQLGALTPDEMRRVTRECGEVSTMTKRIEIASRTISVKGGAEQMRVAFNAVGGQSL